MYPKTQTLPILGFSIGSVPIPKCENRILLTVGEYGQDGVVWAADEVAGGDHAQDEGKVPSLGQELDHRVAGKKYEQVKVAPVIYKLAK